VSTTIALITGANRGLGLAVARQLALTGAHAIIASRDLARGELAAASMRHDGLAATAVQLDVASASSVEAAASQIDDRFGRLDVLVNNAGILPEATAPMPASPLDVDLFARTFDTNLFGAVRMIQCFLPSLQRSLSGRIVNVSSTMGSLADQDDPRSPYHGVVLPAYQASKAALNSVTIAVAKHLVGTPVKITAVCPGWVQTDLGGPANRAAAPLTAEQAARVVVDAALLPDDEPSGRFIDAAGIVPW
jgi:NAD(P)-dependent dehydrogenase (short-subunit alcohol dehydrogenase family)